MNESNFQDPIPAYAGMTIECSRCSLHFYYLDHGVEKQGGKKNKHNEKKIEQSFRVKKMEKTGEKKKKNASKANGTDVGKKKKLHTLFPPVF